MTRRATWSIGEALAWLDRHVNLEAGAARRVAAPTLDRIRRLTELLGSPQLEFPVVHLTGTNGKTTSNRMISGLLVARGLSTGTYTSPHLQRVNERIGWNSIPIDDTDLADVLATVATVEDTLSEPSSFFELLTAAAYRLFADIAVNVAVVEVGLGGTWDATNVADARVAVITNVSIDHVEYLGPTRESIGLEKAGIVKPDSLVVCGETDDDLVRIMLAGRPYREVWHRNRHFGVRSNRPAHGGRVVSLYTPSASYDELFLPLHGAHQGDNAAVALAAAEAFFDGEPLSRDVVEEAFAAVRSPGRLEVAGHQPLVLLDGAHNVAGAHALVAALKEEFVSSRRTFVIGLLREKEPHEMLTALGATRAHALVLCRPPTPRALAAEDVADAAVDLGVDRDRIIVVDEVAEAVAKALAITEPDGQVVVSGSLYTVGAARTALGLS
jgi:dihydrofolate synthase/folylpolyglutamate synthase